MKLKRLITVVLSSVLLFGGLGALKFSNETKVEEAEAATHNTHPENFNPYTYSGSYYNGISGTGTTLRSALTTLIFPKDWYTYKGTSGECLAKILQSADQDPTNSSNMIYYYTRDSVKKNAADTWNREHCWPQSDSNDCWGTGKAGTDILHIRPTYSTTNSTRGNLLYGPAGSNAKTREYEGVYWGKTGNGYFEPLDSVKGDAARICMYIWVAYYNYYGSKLPALTKVFSDFDTLISWHTQDKPDVLEGHRNDVSESSLQKNRNPFVDHPEYAWKIFGDKCSTAVLNAAKEAYPDSVAPTPSEYTVTFNSNGGSAVSSQTVTAGQTANKPDDPSKDGYDFVGWFNGTTEFNFNTPINSNIALTAHWQVQSQVDPFVVEFNSNGGSVVASQYINDGEFATQPDNPTKAGYDFEGWYLNDTLFDFDTPITSDITLVAHWEEQQAVEPETYLILFDSDGGTEVESQTVEEGELLVEPQKPTKEGYDFAGWYLGEEKFDFTKPVYEDFELTAHWTTKVNPDPDPDPQPGMHTVTFDSDGGSLVNKQFIEDGELVNIPTDPTKEGYIFKGWYLGEEEYDFYEPVKEDITLVAHWEAEETLDPVDPEPDPDPVDPDPIPVTRLMVRIEIKTLPTKLIYNISEELDFTGLVITVTYNDETTEDITDISKFEFNKPATDSVGEKTVFVSYSEGSLKKVTYFDITVVDTGGCGGSIIASSAIISLTSLLGLGLILIKKKH